MGVDCGDEVLSGLCEVASNDTPGLVNGVDPDPDVDGDSNDLDDKVVRALMAMLGEVLVADPAVVVR